MVLPRSRALNILRLHRTCNTSQFSIYHNSCNPLRSLPHLSTIANALHRRTKEDGQGDALEILGSVRTVRKQKWRAFLEIGDGSTVHGLQAVLSPAQGQGLSTGALVLIKGIWQASPPGKEQTHELHAEEVTVVGAADSETYPIQKKFQTPEYLRTVPHLRLRLPTQSLLTRLRSDSDFLLAQYFRDRGFLRLQPPIITSSDCEGAGEVFSVNSKLPISTAPHNSQSLDVQDGVFFRKPKYLTVSSQLHLEAYMHEHPKVWTFSPTFRAEKSDTPRHVSEFWMLEVELRTQSLDEVMDIVEDMIRSLVQGLRKSPFLQELEATKVTPDRKLAQEAEAEQNLIRSRWANLLGAPWPRISYSHAIEILQDSVRSGESEFVHQPSSTTGLQLEHEKFIAAKVGHGQPVFVTDYPQSIKPFYMLPSNAKHGRSDRDIKTAACFDLLLPDICEVVGGSLREHRLPQLEASMLAKKTEPASSQQGDMASPDMETQKANSSTTLD
ncbi:MAG: hypothetical protein Q9174_003676, partial [Haloplaca sp. 1 TL-2023]